MNERHNVRRFIEMHRRWRGLANSGLAAPRSARSIAAVHAATRSARRRAGIPTSVPCCRIEKPSPKKQNRQDLEQAPVFNDTIAEALHDFRIRSAHIPPPGPCSSSLDRVHPCDIVDSAMVREARKDEMRILEAPASDASPVMGQGFLLPSEPVGQLGDPQWIRRFLVLAIEQFSREGRNRSSSILPIASIR